MRLNKNQIDLIEKRLRDQGLIYGPVKDEAIDEVATSIEMEMAQGITFDVAFKHVFSNIDKKEVKELQKNIIKTLVNNYNLKKFQKRRSLFLAGWLIIWVLAEYTIGLITNVRELGPFYGLLSTLLIVVILYSSLKTINKTFFESFGSFKNLFFSGIKISFLSSILFGSFLIFFWTYVYPDFYETFQMDFNEVQFRSNRFLVGSVIGACVGVFVHGLIVSLTVSIIEKNKGH